MSRLKVICVVGTRPEAIKMAPIVKDLKARSGFEVFLLSTGQHREMLAQVFQNFSLAPDQDLEIMTERQGLNDILARAIPGLDAMFAKTGPDLVLVQGDTSTAFIAGLVAFNRHIKVGHVEAGLRSFDKWQPFPEEVNRRLISVVADYSFAPTARAKEHLVRERIPEETVFVAGNTVIDALFEVVRTDYVFTNKEVSAALTAGTGGKTLLVTAHRRENWGEPLHQICQAVRRLLEDQPNLRCIWPVHLNPAVREVVFENLADMDRVHLTSPLEYSDLANLMDRVDLIWTDSGGIQEEAPSLNKPILVLRNVTERPEGVANGAALLVGSDPRRLVQETVELLAGPERYQAMAAVSNPYGDGKAAERIGDYLAWKWGLSPSQPVPFTG